MASAEKNVAIVLSIFCLLMVAFANDATSTENFHLDFQTVKVTGDYNAAKGITAMKIASVEGNLEVDSLLEVKGTATVPVLEVQGDMMQKGTLNVDKILVTGASALTVEGDLEVNGVPMASQFTSATKSVHLMNGVEVSGTLISHSIEISGGRLDLNGDVPINGSITGPLIWPAGDLLTINGTMLRVEGAIMAEKFISDMGKVTFTGTLQLRAPLETQFIRSLSGQVIVNKGLRIARAKKSMDRTNARSPPFRSLLLTQSDMQSYVSLRTEIKNMGKDYVQIFKGHRLCPSTIDFGLSGVEGGSVVFTVRAENLANGQFHYNVVGVQIQESEKHDGHFTISGLGDSVNYHVKFGLNKCEMFVRANRQTRGVVKVTGLQRGALDLLYPSEGSEESEFDVVNSDETPASKN